MWVDYENSQIAARLYASELFIIKKKRNAFLGMGSTPYLILYKIF